MHDSEYGLDPQGRQRYYGIYAATVLDVNDPKKKSRIKVRVDQPNGSAIGDYWAEACLPITSNANHPDHLEHTAAQVAALLTTGAASIDSHTHTVQAAGSGTLNHPHKTVANTTEKWNDSQETNTTDEHTPHRIIARKNQHVWVMFEAGLTEYPVWIGVKP
jgi:hypothetical protein